MLTCQERPTESVTASICVVVLVVLNARVPRVDGMASYDREVLRYCVGVCEGACLFGKSKGQRLTMLSYALECEDVAK